MEDQDSVVPAIKGGLVAGISRSNGALQDVAGGGVGGGPFVLCLIGWHHTVLVARRFAIGPHGRPASHRECLPAWWPMHGTTSMVRLEAQAPRGQTVLPMAPRRGVVSQPREYLTAWWPAHGPTSLVRLEVQAPWVQMVLSTVPQRGVVSHLRRA
jgi:hypothetical protein